MTCGWRIYIPTKKKTVKPYTNDVYGYVSGGDLRNKSKYSFADAGIRCRWTWAMELDVQKKWQSLHLSTVYKMLQNPALNGMTTLSLWKLFIPPPIYTHSVSIYIYISWENSLLLMIVCSFFFFFGLLEIFDNGTVPIPLKTSLPPPAKDKKHHAPPLHNQFCRRTWAALHHQSCCPRLWRFSYPPNKRPYYRKCIRRRQIRGRMAPP